MWHLCDLLVECIQSGHFVAERAEFIETDWLVLSERSEHHRCLEAILDLAEILLLLGSTVGEEGVVTVLLGQEVVGDDEGGLDELSAFGDEVTGLDALDEQVTEVPQQ